MTHSTRTAAVIAVASLFAAVAARPGAAVTVTSFRLVAGTTDAGEPTPLWLELLSRRNVETGAASPARSRRPISAAESAWVERIRASLPAIERDLEDLARPFAPAALPPDVRVVTGNRGGSDAFTHDPATIGFDVAALQAQYGDAGSPENGERIRRFLRHETTHLFQKAWNTGHPAKLDRPLDRALAECWSEGHGNFHSLSERWLSGDRGLSQLASATLERLAPRFVERFAALACASPEAERALTADLSNGRFDEKWGALPVALWLALETRRSPAALRDFVNAGPPGVRDLARRHLPAALLPAFEEAFAKSAACAGSGVEPRAPQPPLIR